MGSRRQGLFLGRKKSPSDNDGGEEKPPGVVLTRYKIQCRGDRRCLIGGGYNSPSAYACLFHSIIIRKNNVHFILHGIQSIYI